MEIEWNTKKAKILDLLSILIEEDNNTKQVAIEKVEELTKQNMMLEKENEALKNKLMGFEAAELMKTDNSTGDYYVYGFFNKEWNDWFYIGKGCHNRINQTEGRNDRIIAILNNYDCERRIIRDNLSEKDALLLEQDTKIQFMLQGKPIVDYEKTWSAFRQKQGIEKAKKEGKYIGRKPVNIDMFLFEKLYVQYHHREINKSEFARKLKISRPTLEKVIKRYDEDKVRLRNESAKNSLFRKSIETLEQDYLLDGKYIDECMGLYFDNQINKRELASRLNVNMSVLNEILGERAD